MPEETTPTRPLLVYVAGRMLLHVRRDNAGAVPDEARGFVGPVLLDLTREAGDAFGDAYDRREARGAPPRCVGCERRRDEIPLAFAPARGRVRHGVETGTPSCVAPLAGRDPPRSSCRTRHLLRVKRSLFPLLPALEGCFVTRTLNLLLLQRRPARSECHAARAAWIFDNLTRAPLYTARATL